jgi:signal transduction histidine kinase
VQATLFSPFTRAVSGERTGLGLGLYIVSELARAHGGWIEVVSNDAETKFTCRVPAGAETSEQRLSEAKDRSGDRSSP